MPDMYLLVMVWVVFGLKKKLLYYVNKYILMLYYKLIFCYAEHLFSTNKFKNAEKLRLHCQKKMSSVWWHNFSLMLSFVQWSNLNN